MDGTPFMPDRQIASSDLREHSRNGETVSNSEFVNSLLAKTTGMALFVADRMIHSLSGLNLLG
jgi:hypothetical protein